MRFQMTRDFYIPKGRTKVSHKLSDAVAYIYTTAGAPYAAIFYGNQAKPVAHYRYRSEAEREASVAKYFAGRQAHQEYITERRAARRDALNTIPTDGYISTAQTAVLVRAALKKAFPGVKFSVRTESYSMGSNMRIGWADGPTRDQVSDITDAFSSKRFDGMIDMSYSVDSWLLPDGSAVYGGTRGTLGSMGSVAADEVEKPHPEARKVHFGGSTPSLTRDISPAFQATCDRRWSELSVREQVDLMNGPLPRWAQDRADHGLSYITAA